MTMHRPPTSKGSTDRWENKGGPTRSSEMSTRDDLRSELEKYGIMQVQLTVFDWGGYRYSNLADAIAAAKRVARSG